MSVFPTPAVPDVEDRKGGEYKSVERERETEKQNFAIMLNPESATSARELSQKHGFKSWILSELTFAEHNLEKDEAKCSQFL